MEYENYETIQEIKKKRFFDHFVKVKKLLVRK